MADATSRDHHYVSRSYLAGFTIDGSRKGRLYETDLVLRVVRPSKPRRVAFRRDFDRIEVEGLPPDAFEKALSTFEGYAVTAIRSICKSDTLRDEDLNYVINYMALLTVRNPRMRDAATAAREYEFKVIMDWVTSDKRRFECQVARAKRSGDIREDLNPSFEAVREAVENEQYGVTVSSDESLRLELACFDGALQSFGSRYWSLVTAKDTAPEFVTCDHPVATIFEDSNARGPIGYAMPNSEVSFPLDARHALVGIFENRRPRHVLGGPELVRAINSRTVTRAYRSVFSRAPVVTVLRSDGLAPYLDAKAEARG